MYYNPICLQPTTPTNLAINDLTEHPVLYWTASQPISGAHYEVWRKICGGFKYCEIIEDWTCIVGNLPETNYLDREIYLSGSSYKAYYKIRAVSGDGCIYSPGWSNEVNIIGNFLPLDRQPSKQKLSIDTTARFNLFPNPFNSSLRINLSSPTKEITEIAIYDLQGRIVKAFHPTFGNSYFDTVWNGADNQGQPIHSGIYFLLARSGDETLFSQKIIYLK